MEQMAQYVKQDIVDVKQKVRFSACVALLYNDMSPDSIVFCLVITR